jgi:AraC-like DNA-binding protein
MTPAAEHARVAQPRLQTLLVRPLDGLRAYVWCYGQSQGRVTGLNLTMPLPARPKHVLSFFFAERPGDGRAGGPPRSAVLGPQTHQRLNLSVGGEVDSFTIHFQPSGLRQLFGLAMGELADASHDGEAMLGRPIAALWRRLGDVSDFGARVAIADSFLLQLTPFARPADPVALAANHVFRMDGEVRVDALAARCGLSSRQFERRFFDQTGVSPKAYARITRFNAALDRKLASPRTSWTEIAHALGYADQMHLIHDFRELAGDTPSRFAARLSLAPELHTMFATERRVPWAPAGQVSDSYYSRAPGPS